MADWSPLQPHCRPTGHHSIPTVGRLVIIPSPLSADWSLLQHTLSADPSLALILMWSAASAGPLLMPIMSHLLTSQSPEKWLNTLRLNTNGPLRNEGYLTHISRAGAGNFFLKYPNMDFWKSWLQRTPEYSLNVGSPSQGKIGNLRMNLVDYLGKFWLWIWLNFVPCSVKFWASNDVGGCIQVKFEGHPGGDQFGELFLCSWFEYSTISYSFIQPLVAIEQNISFLVCQIAIITLLWWLNNFG